MATSQPAPDPRRQPKNLVDSSANDDRPESEALDGGQGDGQQRGSAPSINRPKRDVEAANQSKPPQKPPAAPSSGGGGRPLASPTPAAPPVKKPGVGTEGVGERLPEDLPAPDDQDDDRPDPRDFEEKEKNEPDQDNADKGEGKEKGEKGESGKKEGKEKGPEKGGGPKPGGPSPGSGASGGMGGASGASGAAEGAGGAAGKAVAQTAIRAALFNPYGLAGVLAFVLIFGGLMAFLVPAGMAGNKSGGGGNQSQDSGTGSDVDVSGNFQQLSKQLLDSKNVSVTGNPESSLQAAAKGDCSPTGSGGCVKLNAKMLAAILGASAQFPLTLNSFTTGTHSATGGHYQGRAVDIANVDRERDLKLIEYMKKHGATAIYGPTYLPAPYADADHSGANAHLHFTF